MTATLEEIDYELFEEEVHFAFGVDFSSIDTPLQTVGDLHDFLERRMETAAKGQACATLVALNQIRSALKDLAPDQTIRPGDTLVSFGRSPSGILRHIKRRTGLSMPPPNHKLWGFAGLLAFYCCFFVFPVALVTPWPDAAFVIAVAAAGIILASTDPQTLKPDCLTVGDLARKVARRNIARLGAQGARIGRQETWEALVELLREAAPNDVDITPATRFA